MPATTPLGIHYPISTDAPNEALGMSTMATDIDTLITALQAMGITAASGVVSITPVAGAFTAVTVTFPTGRFATAPIVVAFPVLTGTGSLTACGLNGDPTNVSCSIGVTRSNTTVTKVHWVALITP